jgi:hypothetical protein
VNSAKTSDRMSFTVRLPISCLLNVPVSVVIVLGTTLATRRVPPVSRW